MKYKIIYTVFFLLVLISSFSLGEAYDHYKSQKWLDANSITKSDIDKVRDIEFLKGLKVGGHCVQISERKQKTDKICIDGMTRITSME